MRQQIFGDLPAFVQGADELSFWYLDVVKKRFAEWRGAADQLDRLRAHSLTRHVKK